MDKNRKLNGFMTLFGDAMRRAAECVYWLIQNRLNKDWNRYKFSI